MPVRQKNTWWQDVPWTSSCCRGAEAVRCSDLMWHGSRAPWRSHLLGGKCKNNHVFGCVFELRETAAKEVGDEIISMEIRQEK